MIITSGLVLMEHIDSSMNNLIIQLLKVIVLHSAEWIVVIFDIQHPIHLHRLRMLY